MSFIIGEDVRVAAARDAALLGLRGTLVLESMHTFTIRTGASKNVVLPKVGSALELSSGRILIGDDMEGRLEDRIARTKTSKRGARRRQ